MSEKTYTSDDPRVTAYALDELDQAERAEFERQLADSPELRAAVEDVRAFSEQFAAELKTEPTPALTESQRAALKSASVTAAVDPSPPRRRYLAVVATGATVLSLALLAMLLPPGNRLSDSMALGPQAATQSPDGVEFTDSDDASASSDYLMAQLGDRESSEAHGNTGIAAWSRDRQDLTSGRHRGRQSEVLLGTSSGGSQAGGKAGGESDGDGWRLRFDEYDAGPGRGFDVSGSSARPSDAPAAAEGTIRPHVASSLKRPGTGLDERRNATTAETAPAPDASQPAGPPAAQEPANESRQVQVLTNETKPLDRPFGEEASPTPTAGKPASGGESGQQGQQQGLGNRPNANAGGFADDDMTGEAYNPIVENEFQSPTKDPLSTFSIDVDTASYANVRRFLTHGQWPPADAVRIEELVNYFRYDYPEPEGEHPFSVALEAAACPWNPDHRLVRIGLQGKDFDREQRPPSSLVFLIDVSGSMRPNNKLPLVKDSLTKLVDQMTEDDHIAIVTYAGNAGLVLDSTSGEHKDRILAAINGLGAGGSTNGAGGIQLAYETAIRHFYDKGANRVILCTDGDFNVGVSDDNQLVSMITDKAKTGVFLSVFGFGMGNLKDAKLEQLADKGNGQYGYIDDQREAYKVFGEELTGTLYTIAKDVKIQVEFNPSRVGAYRLIGYENRALAARDFNDDTKDAGEIGAGHRVTALYEIIPPEKLAEPPAGVDPLKYQKPAKPQVDDKKGSKELLTVKLRYKQPDEDQSTKLEVPLVDPANPKAMPSQEFEFAAAVAAFGMILRDSQFRSQADLDLVQELARGNRGDDNNGHRQEFLELVKRAKELQPNR